MVTVYTQGDGRPDLVRVVLRVHGRPCSPGFGFDLVENIVCTGANDPEAAERDAALKIRAYEAGKALRSAGRVSLSASQQASQACV